MHSSYIAWCVLDKQRDVINKEVTYVQANKQTDKFPWNIAEALDSVNTGLQF